MKALLILAALLLSVPATAQVLDTTTRGARTVYSLRFASDIPRREVVARVADLVARNGGYLTYAAPELGALSAEAWYDLAERRVIGHLHVAGDGDSLFVTAFYTTDDTGPDKLDRTFEYGPLTRILADIRTLATKPK